MSVNSKMQAKTQLEEADRLWASGRKAEAVKEYKTLIERNLSYVDKGKHQAIFVRVVEFEADNGDVSVARRFIERAEKEKLSLSLSSPKAKELAAQVGKEREDKIAADLAKKEERRQKTKEAARKEAEGGTEGVSSKKEAAFQKIVDKLKKSPGNLASREEREQFNKEVDTLVGEFDRLPLDIKANKENRDAAIRIVESYRKNIEGRFQGQIIRELEGKIADMVSTLMDY